MEKHGLKTRQYFKPGICIAHQNHVYHWRVELFTRKSFELNALSVSPVTASALD